MKEIDDTPVTENETEDLETICALLYPQVSAFIEIEMHRILERLDDLALRVATLESRRMLQNDPNDDEEWY